jgi:hypothetical protein
MIKALATALGLLAIGGSFAAAQSTAAGNAGVTTPAVAFVDRTSSALISTANLLLEVAGAGTDEADGIVDPGNLVGIDIAESYARANGYAVSPTPLVLLARNAPTQAWIVEAARGPSPAAYVVDGGSPSIRLHYSLRDMSHYRITYRSTVRIFAGADGRTLATAACDVTSADTHRLDEVKANDGAILKLMVLATAKSCADQVREQLKLGARGASEQDMFASPIPRTFEAYSGHAMAVAEPVADTRCSPERQAYAQKVGVDCRDLGQPLSKTPPANAAR